MDIRMTLQEIKNEVDELLQFAEGTTDQQMALDLVADQGEMNTVHDKLVEFGTDIRLELSR